MKPEAIRLVIVVSSAVFGLVAKDRNPWFVVWVFLSAIVVVALGLSGAR
jgi:hypothetical protein